MGEVADKCSRPLRAKLDEEGNPVLGNDCFSVTGDRKKGRIVVEMDPNEPSCSGQVREVLTTLKDLAFSDAPVLWRQKKTPSAES